MLGTFRALDTSQPLVILNTGRILLIFQVGQIGNLTVRCGCLYRLIFIVKSIRRLPRVRIELTTLRL